MLRRVARIALHFLFATALVLPGVAAQVQALTADLQALHATHAMAMQDMPCGEEMDDSGAPPCDCTSHHCDMTACLGTGCLPDLPRVMAYVPPQSWPSPWTEFAVPARLPDTPLRPPIA